MPFDPGPPTSPVPALAAELQQLQRQRAVVIKSRIMQANRLQAVVAGTLGYHSGMAEKDRLKKFAEASEVIQSVKNGSGSHPMECVIMATLDGVGAFGELEARLEKQMVEFAKRLPVAGWVKAPGQRGFGLSSLAVVVGEAGDLANYPNPAKLWKRMGCAPFTSADQTRMGSTWRAKREGTLSKEEWEDYGYSPRRRSVAYVIGENLIMRNGPGPYRARYDEAKAVVKARHPDYSPLRCHRHGMLLATKRLLLNLWVEWHKAE